MKTFTLIEKALILYIWTQEESGLHARPAKALLYQRSGITYDKIVFDTNDDTISYPGYQTTPLLTPTS